MPSEADINANLRTGRRGLRGGSSLARLLAQHRGYRNRAALPSLTEAKSWPPSARVGFSAVVLVAGPESGSTALPERECEASAGSLGRCSHQSGKLRCQSSD